MRKIWHELAQPDMSLLRSWSPETAASMPFQQPYVAVFSDGPKQLLYVAARHPRADDPTSHPPSSATCQTIKGLFADINTRPDLVVLEGIAQRGQYSQPDFLEKAISDAQNNFKDSAESAFAAYLAHKSGIPFSSGEPSELDTLRELQRRGYSALDAVCFDVTLYLQQEARQRRLSPHTDAIEREGHRLLNGFARRYGMEAPSFAQLVDWYKAKAGHPMTLDALCHLSTEPPDNSNANYFQRLGTVYGLVREPAIVQNIFNELQQRDRVMVVFGAAHEAKQRPVFQKVFRQAPYFLKPF